MSLRKIYNLFKRYDPLTRKDIETYRKTKDESVRHEIEQKSLSSDFESDALEGWDQSEAGLSAMEKVDKRFLPKSTGLFWLFGGVLTLGIFVLILFINSPLEESVPQKDIPPSISEPILVEQTDLKTPVHIEQMKELPKKEQILVSTLKIKNDQLKNSGSLSKNDATYEVDILPTKKLEAKKLTPEPIFKQLNAKEIYLEGLKLIDYRKYRSKPSITTFQLDLTGISADKETTRSSSENVWREIEIPYMNYLQKTMDHFSHGSFKHALSRFEEIIKFYPDDINALFYGGLCYFNLGQFEKATAFFEKCREQAFINFFEEATWYLGLSLERNGKMEDAKHVFENIVKDGGFYAMEAKSKLMKN